MNIGKKVMGTWKYSVYLFCLYTGTAWKKCKDSRLYFWKWWNKKHFLFLSYVDQTSEIERKSFPNHAKNFQHPPLICVWIDRQIDINDFSTVMKEIQNKYEYNFLKVFKIIANLIFIK